MGRYTWKQILAEGPRHLFDIDTRRIGEDDQGQDEKSVVLSLASQRLNQQGQCGLTSLSRALAGHRMMMESALDLGRFESRVAAFHWRVWGSAGLGTVAADRGRHVASVCKPGQAVSPRGTGQRQKKPRRWSGTVSIAIMKPAIQTGSRVRRV